MKIGYVNLSDFPLLLAPMEDVSDPPFRALCKKHGADLMYTEFISSEGLIREAKKSIEKLEALAFLVAVIDGITEEEGWELNTFAGRIRGFYALRKAVEVHEKTGDIDKAMTHVSGAPVVHTIVTFGAPQPKHIQKISDELDDAIKDSENPIDEYDAL